MPNILYYGDNLDILRDYIAAESVALVFLDPPFNNNRGYNVLFRYEAGAASGARDKRQKLFLRQAPFEVLIRN